MKKILLVCLVLLVLSTSSLGYTRASSGGKLWINGQQLRGSPNVGFSAWDLGQGYIQIHGTNSDWKDTTLSIAWDFGKKNPRGWYWVQGSRPVYFKLSSFSYSIDDTVSFQGVGPTFTFKGENMNIDPAMSWRPLPHF